MNEVAVCFTAFGVTALLLWLLRPLAVRIDLVDHPGVRKLHRGSIALIGGIAMFCGIVFAVLMYSGSLDGFRPFFAAAVLLVIVGILDDFHELPSWARFAAQVVAVLMMTLWGGVVVTDLGGIAGTDGVELGWWGVPFTVFATIGVINAINMIDGADGLAGGVALIALALFAGAAYSGGRDTDAVVLALVACTVAAFLLFNARLPGRKHALVFMGDAGSMLLGFVLAWFAVSLSQGENRVVSPVTVLWVLALPLIDTVSIMIRRRMRGRLMTKAGRDHFHHLLLDSGCSVNATVGIMVVWTAVAGMVGVGGVYLGLSEWTMFVGFLLVGLTHLWILGRLARVAARREADRRGREKVRAVR